ncbi:MAG: histone deacetylase [Planctomycetota bacterium]|nr:MAG: histone deacetylase [Planctomycetota bacterium]
MLFTDPLFERHVTGAHPECPERLQSIRRRLNADGLIERCLPGPIRDATEEEIGRVHPPEHVALIRELAEQGGGRIDSDTVVSPESYEVAVSAAGTGCSAVDRVLSGEAKRALCLIRPPGHHATRNRAMGFCLFNNIAIAAEHARAAHGLKRVLIVDWDVHHGNGTQDIFYADGDVHFFSMHRSPFYPGTGAAEETGTGPGAGATWNVPMAFGATREDYFRTFQETLESAAESCKPELILVSAGFDAHRSDPVGSLGLESEDFATLTQIVLRVAAEFSGGRTVCLLEGGYHLVALADSVACHVRELLEEAQP